VKFMNALGSIALIVPVFAYGSGCSSGSTHGGGSGSTLGGSGSGSGEPGSDMGSTSGNGGSGPESSSGSSSGSGSGTSGGGTAADAGPTDSTCAAQSSNTSCQQCCTQLHPAGVQTFLGALLTCACGVPDAGPAGNCASACAASACAARPTSPSPGDACYTCLSGDLEAANGGVGACDQTILNACSNDSNCRSFAGCVQPCLSKP
jgi:hypothetical protein